MNHIVKAFQFQRPRNMVEMVLLPPAVQRTVLMLSLSLLTCSMLLPFLRSDMLPGWGDDPYFCAFTLKEVARKFSQGWWPHQGEFWNIGMFVPSSRVLALSDPLIVPGFLVAGLQVLGLSLALSINFVFVAFVLIGWWGASVMLKAFGIPSLLACCGGWLWAFSSHNLSQSAHFQNTTACCLPLVLAGAALLRLGDARGPWMLLGGLLVVGFTNLYYLYFSIVALGLWILSLVVVRSGHFRGVASCLLWGGVASIILLSVVYRYFEVRQFFPHLADARPFWLQQHFAARLPDYFSSNLTAPFYREWLPVSENFERNAFPGLMTLLLAALGLLLYISRMCLRRTVIVMKDEHLLVIFALLLLLIGSLAASGPLLFPEAYLFLRSLLPGFSDIRAVGRFGLLVVTAEICLAMYALAVVWKSALASQGRLRGLLTCFLVVAIFVQCVERVVPEFRSWQVPINVNSESSRLVEVLQVGQTEEAVLELGTGTSQQVHVQALQHGLMHRMRLINGYSGSEPPGYVLAPLQEAQADCDAYRERHRSLLDLANLLVLNDVSVKQLEQLEACFSLDGFNLLDQGLEWAVLKRREVA